MTRSLAARLAAVERALKLKTTGAHPGLVVLMYDPQGELMPTPGGPKTAADVLALPEGTRVIAVRLRPGEAL